MNDFTFYSPTYFVFGKDTEMRSAEMIRRFGGSRVLILYGGGSAERSGLLGRIRGALDGAGIPHAELGGVLPNPRSGLVYRGIEQCRADGTDFILAVGGGSVIDSAKAIAAGVVYEGDFWDYFREGKPVTRALPVGTVLTIPAAGSEGSPDCVITLEDGMLKRGMTGEALRPAFSILNPELTCSLPPFQTACGAADIMAHVMERYFTRTTDVETTDRLCEALLAAMVHEVPRVLADPDNYGARANIMWAGIVAHNNIVGVGRTQDWASHNLEHELSALYDVAHGAGLAVVFPAWMTYVYKADVTRFAQFASRVFGIPMDFADPERTALDGIARLKAVFASFGLPTDFAGLGAREEDIPLMVGKLGLDDGKTLGGFVRLNAQDCLSIYRLMV
ncbi:MAG: iron-containing alcohol dehydrogenase [Clostridia bacterium]|nr:iron-containing alcohol dehydrogenase [Clostridia bacterium]